MSTFESGSFRVWLSFWVPQLGLRRRKSKHLCPLALLHHKPPSYTEAWEVKVEGRIHSCQILILPKIQTVLQGTTKKDLLVLPPPSPRENYVLSMGTCRCMVQGVGFKVKWLGSNPGSLLCFNTAKFAWILWGCFPYIDALDFDRVISIINWKYCKLKIHWIQLTFRTPLLMTEDTKDW
jgi:hypothetical protein